MTKREACEFFYRYGNVGIALLSDPVKAMMKQKPTYVQLLDACASALNNGQDQSIVAEAKAAIERWSEDDGIQDDGSSI